jgi:DNA-binding ferritin-like protein (Dps family)
MTMFIEKIIGDLGNKRQWREHKARVAALPASYRQTVEALQRYLMYYGAIANGDTLMKMLTDLADLFEQASAEGTPIRAVVGDDPVEFAETLLRNYSDGQWINKERQRLVQTIARAEAEEEGS